MSKYVNRMKDILISFEFTAKEIHGKIERNSAAYLPDVTADVNARLQADLNKAAADARSQINAIHDEAAAAARKWGELLGADIDTADMGLLKGDFQLSQDTVWKLLVKHQGNATMVNAIAKYAKINNILLDYVPCVEDKLFAYKSFAQSAHNMVGQIVQTGSGLALSEWGKPGNISQRMETILYGIKEKEDPSIKPLQENFDFGFKPLDGRT